MTATTHPNSSAIRALLAGLALVMAGLAVPASAAAVWSGPVEISDADTRNAADLDVDASDLGAFVAAWGYGTNDIATVVDPAAGGPGAPQEFTGDFAKPTIGIGGNEVGAVAFQSTLGGSSFGIFAASKPGASNSFGAATQIQGPNNENATGNAILAVNHLGTAQLFHEIGNASFGFGHNVRARVLTDPGANTWSAGNDFGAGQSFTHNRVAAAGPDGSTVMLWKSDNGINFRTIETAVVENDGSASKGSNIEASSGNDPGDLSSPSGIAVDRMPDSSVVAAYATIPGGPGGIYAADFSKARAASGSGDVGAVRMSDDADGSAPEIATDNAGNTLLTWYDPSDGGADPNALRARFRPSGGSFGATETIAQGDVTGNYDMEMDSVGRAHVVFETNTANTVEASSRSQGPSGTWSAPELLSGGLAEAALPQVAVGRNFEAFAAWTADPDSNNSERVYMATLPQPACADVADNDGDGHTDFPADPGCASATDDDETDPVDPGDPGNPGDPSNPGNPGNPGDPGNPGNAGDDETAPAGEASKKGKAKAGKTIKLKVSSDEDGTIRAKGTQQQTKAAKKGRSATVELGKRKGKKLKVKLKTARTTIAAGETETLRLKPKGKKNKKKAKQLKKAVKRGAKAKAKITVTFSDEAGNTNMTKLGFKLK